MKLKISPVCFNEEEHTYTLGEKRLLGITGLIHSILGLGVYPEADDYVKDFIIPKAGSRGTAIHHAIQTYDQIGIRQTEQYVNTRYGCRERDNVQYVLEEWNVESELENYIRHQNGFEAVANEHTVSDNEKYASQIDNVWLRKSTKGIWLVDTKSNNIDLYPKCGYFQDDYFRNGEEALKEYLSWQLSVYAELFEQENPGIKVEGLACNWLRKEDSAFWVIARKPAKLVKELLSTDYIFTESGTPVYLHHDLSVFGIGAPVEKKENALIIPQDIISTISSTLKFYEETSRNLEKMKTMLRAAMEKGGVKSWDCGVFRATIAADSETTSFDTTRFKLEHPDLYEQYTIKKIKKGGFTIKAKKDD